LILAALLVVSPAYSEHDQQVCGPRREAVEQLALKYNEHAIGAGLSARGYVLEIYVSESRTWTALLVKPDGIACLADSGSLWRAPDVGAIPGNFTPIDYELTPIERIRSDFGTVAGAFFTTISYEEFKIVNGFTPQNWPAEVDRVGLVGSHVTQLGLVYPMIGSEYIGELMEFTTLSHILELMGSY
jgi:hypothetical protein